MSSYNELIKNFEKIRAYMRDFYVYGFKSREEYDGKSARSYDNERRRLESWLGDHMSFRRTADGKSVFISIDSRSVSENPLYKAWKAKSFTDGDITLHFILFDILSAPDSALDLGAIMAQLDEAYLSHFNAPHTFDESTVRKKLQEYTREGLVLTERRGHKTYYRPAEGTDLTAMGDPLRFFSEVAPCGVIGSFLLDKCPQEESPFRFKHHYITAALDSNVLACLLDAMQRKAFVTVTNSGHRQEEPKELRLLPLRVFISTQSGRQHLLAWHPWSDRIRTFRLDHLSLVKPGEPCERFDELRARLDAAQPYIWGVNCTEGADTPTETVTFTLRVGPGEGYIVQRLYRECRGGRVEKLEAGRYRFSAELYDCSEILPWIRTFLCRIEELHFSDQALERRFRSDLGQMYRMYGIEDGTGGEGE